MTGYAAKDWSPALPLLLSLSVACALGACDSSEQIRQAQEQRCASDGLQPGTAQFADCMKRESLAQSYRLNQAGTSWGPPNAVPAYAIGGAGR